MKDHLDQLPVRPPRDKIAALAGDLEELIAAGHSDGEIGAGLAWIRRELAAGRHAGAGMRFRQRVWQAHVAEAEDAGAQATASACEVCGGFHEDGQVPPGCR